MTRIYLTDAVTFVVGLLAGMVILFVPIGHFVTYESNLRRKVENEAVRRGFAEIVITESGEREFQWKEGK